MMCMKPSEGTPEFPRELSVPFAGRGNWRFRFNGGPFDGGASYQETDCVIRVGDRQKWTRGTSRPAVYNVTAINAHDRTIYLQYAKTPWAEW